MRTILSAALALALFAGGAVAGPFTPLKPFLGSWKGEGVNKGKPYTIFVRVRMVTPEDEDDMPYALIEYTDETGKKVIGSAKLYPGDEEGLYSATIFPPPGAAVRTPLGSVPLPSKIPASVSAEDGVLQFAAALSMPANFQLKINGQGELSEDRKTMSYSVSGAMLNTTGTLTRIRKPARKKAPAAQ